MENCGDLRHMFQARRRNSSMTLSAMLLMGLVNCLFRRLGMSSLRKRTDFRELNSFRFVIVTTFCHLSDDPL